MAGDWIKIEHALPDKPEVFSMSERLQIDPDAVVGKLVRFWSWCDQQCDICNGDAVTPSVAISVTRNVIDRITHQRGFADALIDAGWLDEDVDGLVVPNFGRHNGQTAKNRGVTNRRVANFRKNGNAAVVASVTDDALQKSLPEKRREEKSKNTPLIPQGGEESAHAIDSASPRSAALVAFDRFYAAYPKKKAKLAAEKAWARAIKRAFPDEIIRGLERAKTSSDWTEANGKYIPHPASWLNAGGWEDEVTPAPINGLATPTQALQQHEYHTPVVETGLSIGAEMELRNFEKHKLEEEEREEICQITGQPFVPTQFTFHLLPEDRRPQQ